MLFVMCCYSAIWTELCAGDSCEFWCVRFRKACGWHWLYWYQPILPISLPRIFLEISLQQRKPAFRKFVKYSLHIFVPATIIILWWSGAKFSGCAHNFIVTTTLASFCTNLQCKHVDILICLSSFCSWCSPSACATNKNARLKLLNMVCHCLTSFASALSPCASNCRQIFRLSRYAFINRMMKCSLTSTDPLLYMPWLAASCTLIPAIEPDQFYLNCLDVLIAYSSTHILSFPHKSPCKEPKGFICTGAPLSEGACHPILLVFLGAVPIHCL